MGSDTCALDHRRAWTLAARVSFAEAQEAMRCATLVVLRRFTHRAVGSRPTRAETGAGVAHCRIPPQVGAPQHRKLLVVDAAGKEAQVELEAAAQQLRQAVGR